MLMTNRGSYRIDLQGWPNLTTPHLVLIARDGALPTQAINTMDELDEYAGAGYTGGFGGASRQVPANLAVAEDDANNRSEMTFDAPTFTGVNGPDPIAPVLVLIEEITNDAGSHVIGFFPVKTTANELAVTAASNANPSSWTTASDHGLTTNDWIYVEGFAGGTWDAAVNGKFFKVTVVDADEFTVQGLDGTSLGTATFATAKIYRPIPMNGADVTLTPNAEGVAQSETVVGAVTS